MSGDLYYNYFRGYDPNTGRYLQSDPIGLEGGLNTYSYVDANPLTYIVSLGLKKIILLPKDDPNYKAAVKTKDDPNECLVISHGNDQFVSRMNAKQLNKRITELGCKPKQPLKLDACRSGQGANSIAEQLAKLRESIVTAPDERTWVTPWDSNISTPYPPLSDDHNSWKNRIPDWSKPGKWRTFDESIKVDKR